ncbi:MAG: lipase [Leptolyngbyaceae cyanobacterium MO_188.B28]|nr:lipase [Leptolyngbyaceae cyanobacterium MO_188.B28]
MPLPTVILPGYLAGAEPYQEMELALQKLGFPAVTVPLKRRDWLPTVGGRSVRPILEQLDQTVRQAMADHGSSTVNLVGHSAGGWISRIYLGEKAYDIHPSDRGKSCLWSAHHQITTLITLGTPHMTQERWTLKNLDFVNQTYPGAYYANQVNYICIAGKSVYGRQNWQGWFTYNSYKLTCGNGDCWGDGITPIEAAHLEGAKNLVLDNVMHSPKPDGVWYGASEVVDNWATYLT